jgi:hypothetical protein
VGRKREAKMENTITNEKWTCGIYPAYDGNGERSYYPAVMCGERTIIDWVDLKEDDAKKIVRSVNGFEELRQAITIAINTIPAIRSRGQYFEDAVIAQLEESLKKAGC